MMEIGGKPRQPTLLPVAVSKSRAWLGASGDSATGWHGPAREVAVMPANYASAQFLREKPA